MPFPPRSGLLAAGNFLVDHVKIVDYYPREEMLASILRESSSNGGGPYNILKDLAKMGAPFALNAAGLIGKDATGDWIVQDCRAHGIEVGSLLRTNEAPTSYTDAFTVESTARRTFFHQRGTNALLAPEHFNLAASTARLFYLGYLMLLDRLDRVEAGGTTGASRVLEAASTAGLITFADMVSLEHPEFARSTAASLPHLDYLLLNEIEAGNLVGRSLRKPHEPDWLAIESAATSLLGKGVRLGVVVHFVEGAVCAHKEGQIFRQGSLNLPPNLMKGATGAGDAFAAGFIWGIHEDYPIDLCLRQAVSAAAMCLGDPTTSEGMAPLAHALALADEYGYRAAE
ncbi:MAG: carbohydrate kinase family protein [Verrucomicrobiales bacterium]